MKIILVPQKTPQQILDERALLERVKQEIEQRKKEPKNIQDYLFPEIEPWQL